MTTAKNNERGVWIPVTSKLPDFEEDVIVAYNETDMCFNHRSNNPEVKTDENGWCILCPITAFESPLYWMRLPELPKSNMDNIAKAVDWLEMCLPDIEYITNASALRQNKKKFIESFKQYMKNETDKKPVENNAPLFKDAKWGDQFLSRNKDIYAYVGSFKDTVKGKKMIFHELLTVPENEVYYCTDNGKVAEFSNFCEPIISDRGTENFNDIVSKIK